MFPSLVFISFFHARVGCCCWNPKVLLQFVIAALAMYWVVPLYGENAIFRACVVLLRIASAVVDQKFSVT